MLKDKIIEHLKLRIDKLKESIREADSIIIEQQNRINYLEQYLTQPKYKQGDVVNVFGIEDKKYIVDCIVCYDTSYPIYNLFDANDIDNEDKMETISEVDIYN